MTTPISIADRDFLQRAVELGRRGWGKVHPNPTVGCILVRDGEVVGEGWHSKVGGPHAEVHAIRTAGCRARGATAYVSLEPCDHFGRTPPCTVALLEAGISRVVYGAEDPGPESSGGGNRLRAHGLEVLGPVFNSREARRENPAFFFNHENHQTYVAVKLAQTLDGRIAETPGSRTEITGAEARLETHRLRAGFDGMLVGSGTALVDNPFLTVREYEDWARQPTRVVLDTRARLSPDSNLFRDIPQAPLVIFTSRDAPAERVERMREAGGTVYRVGEEEPGLSLSSVLDTCWSSGLRSLLCEGGSRLASELIRGGLAQRLYLFMAPFVLGEQGVPAFTGLGSRGIWKAWDVAAPPRTLGRDILMTFDRVA